MPPNPKAIWNERGLIREVLKVGLKSVPKSKAPILEVCKQDAPVITSYSIHYTKLYEAVLPVGCGLTFLESVFIPAVLPQREYDMIHAEQLNQSGFIEIIH